MTPVILETKSGGILVIGGSGGSMITAAVALVTLLYSASMQYLFVCFLICLLTCFSFIPAVYNKSPMAGHESERCHCCSYSVC